YTEGIDGNDNAHNTNFQSRVQFRPTAATSISGRFLVSDGYVRLNSNPDTLGLLPAGVIDAQAGANFSPDVDDPDDTQKTKLFNGQAVVTHRIRERLTLNALYSGLTSSRLNDAGPLGVGFQAAS